MIGSCFGNSFSEYLIPVLDQKSKKQFYKMKTSEALLGFAGWTAFHASIIVGYRVYSIVSNSRVIKIYSIFKLY